jgi:hypothetical protein
MVVRVGLSEMTARTKMRHSQNLSATAIQNFQDRLYLPAFGVSFAKPKLTIAVQAHDRAIW